VIYIYIYTPRTLNNTSGTKSLAKTPEPPDP
jgi:hypothetical protein